MHRDDEPLWVPSAEQVARANMTRFIAEAKRESGGRVSDYASLHEWSIASPEKFWPLVWKFCELIGTAWDSVLVGGERMAPPDPSLGPKWFTGAKLNFAENLLRFDDDRDALVAWTESGLRRRITYAELQR
jgi:acetoacetyl-CoA synthetase